MDMSKRITRKTNTLATYYGPPDVEYSEEKFQELVTGVVKILKPKEWSAVSEPFPDPEVERKSSWHFHLDLWFGLGKTKQITVKQQEKLQTLLNVPAVTHDYTKCSNSADGLQKIVNDMQYAHGDSDKDKEHFDVLESAGFAAVFQAQVENLAEMKTEMKALDGFDPTKPNQYAYALMSKRKMKPTQLVVYARQKSNIVLEMYVVENYTKLCAMYTDLRRINAEIMLEAEELPPDNAFQTAARAVIGSTSNKRDDGQLTVFLNRNGNCGKSMLQDKLYKESGACEFPNAKTADIARAYCYEEMVNFNFARSTDMDKVNYRVIEDLSDGKIFSSKYESGMKRVPKPKINVFCNRMPNVERLSMDRWNIYEWKDNALVCLYKNGIDQSLLQIAPVASVVLRTEEAELAANFRNLASGRFQRAKRQRLEYRKNVAP